MNRSARVLFVALATLAVACLLQPVRAQTATRAVVTADRTNLRAQPSKDAEILASLIKGEPVEVLGVVTPKGSKEAWSRVAMPSSVKVWLYGPLVDKAGVIRGETGNYRAGPGRNYSVLGSVRRGDSVKIVREFDGWVQIEPPADAFAFVATRLLDTRVPTPTAAVPVPDPEPDSAAVTPPPATRPPATNAPPPVPAPAREPVAPEPVPVARPAEPVPTVTTPGPAPVAAVTSPSPAPVAAKARPRFGGSPRDQSNQPPLEEQHPIMTSTDTEPTPLKLDPAPPPSRKVTREGFVRPTVSVQAPTYYELRGGFYEEGNIDYLYISPQKQLDQYSGKRVLVSGEEYRDSRWRTPVLKIEAIELAP